MSYDLTLKMNEAIQMLNKSTEELTELGREKAHKEYLYKTALAKRILEFRADGIPVTIINDLCRGDYDVAISRLERDIAVSDYESARESINAQKLTIRVLESQISREWTSGKGGI